VTVLTATGLTKRFGEGAGAVIAVAGVDLSIDAGEVVLLLGPSGSGKTTLLSILGGLMRPSAGSVEIAGRTLGDDPSDLARIRLGAIGFVFQSFNLLPSLTALDNVALPLRLLGVPGRIARRRAAELLQAFGLALRLQASPKTLSGGEKQRVSLARALVANPLVILADEPTASLDTTNGREAMEILRASTRRGQQACLVVTHDVRLIEYADRILRIEDGRLVEN
jgi:putative ABC transport system ATP-binding protein